MKHSNVIEGNQCIIVKEFGGPGSIIDCETFFNFSNHNVNSSKVNLSTILFYWHGSVSDNIITPCILAGSLLFCVGLGDSTVICKEVAFVVTSFQIFHSSELFNSFNVPTVVSM